MEIIPKFEHGLLPLKAELRARKTELSRNCVKMVQIVWFHYDYFQFLVCFLFTYCLLGNTNNLHEKLIAVFIIFLKTAFHAKKNKHSSNM